MSDKKPDFVDLHRLREQARRARRYAASLLDREACDRLLLYAAELEDRAARAQAPEREAL
jgi:hypothetical protein